ncbi:MAG: 4Fe-4S binding protein [Oscillospiraceae bacterium]|nr:4Fe-4S binding protein [Oscillospiraceae bacterium]
MDAKTCLEKYKRIGVLNFATVGMDGSPQVRCISAIHYEDNAMYFFTAPGKAFYDELIFDGRVQILGYTKFKEMIRTSAVAKLVDESERKKWIDIIFDEQPYLANLYADEKRYIGVIFEIKDAEIEYFNLGVNPIFRELYTIGNGKINSRGYEISEKCIGCGQCSETCPQHAIDSGNPYVINQTHCLHCGACAKVCPANAVIKI